MDTVLDTFSKAERVEAAGAGAATRRRGRA